MPLEIKGYDPDLFEDAVMVENTKGQTLTESEHDDKAFLDSQINHLVKVIFEELKNPESYILKMYEGLIRVSKDHEQLPLKQAMLKAKELFEQTQFTMVERETVSPNPSIDSSRTSSDSEDYVLV